MCIRDRYSRAAAILVEYKDVVIHVYNSRNRDIITNYLEKMTAEVVRSYIAAKSEGENISEKDLEFMSYFYGYAIIGSTYKWIESLSLIHISFAQEQLSDVCVCCGKPAKKMVYWGKAY